MGSRKQKQNRKQSSSGSRRWLVGVCLLIIALVVLGWATKANNEPSVVDILPMSVPEVTTFAEHDPNSPCGPNETWFLVGEVPSLYGSVVQVWSTDSNSEMVNGTPHVVEGSLVCMSSTLKRLPSLCSFTDCLGGPGQPYAADHCEVVDYDHDGDVDIFDFKQFQIDPHVNRDTAPG